MRFNVSQLLKEPTGGRREYELDDEIQDIDDEITAVEPLKGKVKLTRTANGILVAGHLHTAVQIECRRCLQSFTSPVDFDLEEEFVPTIDVTTGVAVPADENTEEALLIDEQHMLDLREVVRQYILLAREQFPVCSQTCAGLCPSCGKNLNEGPCGCQDRSEDPRWSALRELL